MSSSALKTWASVHKWTSVVCTVFLLILCISGLPLLFEDEIEAWTDPSASGEPLPATAPHASLDPMVATAHRLHPGEVVTGIFLDPDAPRVVVHTAISREAANADPGNLHSLAFDAGSGALIGDSERAGDGVARLLRLFFALHTKLMLGTAGLVVVLAMGLLFLVAIVSGIVLYAPFTRRLVFGTVRRDRSARVRRLDTHNLVGVVTMAWALVVGFTGVLNELTGPLFGVWAQQVVAAEAAKWSGGGIAPGTPLASPQAALVTARKALPRHDRHGHRLSRRQPQQRAALHALGSRQHAGDGAALHAGDGRRGRRAAGGDAADALVPPRDRDQPAVPFRQLRRPPAQADLGAVRHRDHHRAGDGVAALAAAEGGRGAVSKPSIWRMPALLAGATLAGLLIALTGGEQPWRAVASALLALPLAVGAAAYTGLWRRR
jgi:uncharacterized iron-regulated membrane protein